MHRRLRIAPSVCRRRSFEVAKDCGGGMSFVASLLKLLQKARLPFWEKQRYRWRSPELRMQILLENDQYNQCALVAPPGNDQEFLLCVCCSKRSGLLRTKETMKVWLLCWRLWRVDRRLKDVSLCSLSLRGSEGRSSKVLVADARRAPVGSSATIRIVSADETDAEVTSVSGATRALVLFCNAVGVKPSPFVPQDFSPRPVSPLPWLPWLCDLPSAVIGQKSVTSNLHLPSKACAPAIVHARWTTTKQTAWIRWCRRWAQSTVTSQTDGDWCAVCGEDGGFACWEPNSCSCCTWQSPTNCHSTFAH